MLRRKSNKKSDLEKLKKYEQGLPTISEDTPEGPTAQNSSTVTTASPAPNVSTPSQERQQEPPIQETPKAPAANSSQVNPAPQPTARELWALLQSQQIPVRSTPLNRQLPSQQSQTNEFRNRKSPTVKLTLNFNNEDPRNLEGKKSNPLEQTPTVSNVKTPTKKGT